MNLLDCISELLRPISVKLNLESFRQELEECGFPVYYKISKNSPEYAIGFNFVFVLPFAANDEFEPNEQEFLKAFYRSAMLCAANAGLDLIASELCLKDGNLAVYVGLK